MFRKIFGKNKEPENQTTRSEIRPEFSVQVRVEDSSENAEPRAQWVDPSNSSWEDYEELFFEDKAWFRDAPQWRKVLEVCHRHWNLDRAIGETYYRREVDGVEPTIPFCKEQMSFAAQAKVAFEFHHRFEQEYQQQFYERNKREWNQRVLGEYPGWEPVQREFQLPEHKGFKQLAIIYDKMKDYQSAVEVCEEALAVNWPGDWDVRITRYERRLNNKKTSSKKAPVVSSNVVTIDAAPSAKSALNFCSNCGNSLEGATNFCSQCGTPLLN